MRWLPGILFIIVALSACKKPAEVTNLNNNKIAVIGHAGNGVPGLNNNLPPDSWEGALEALETYNADGIELDIKMSTDSILFMFHDQELNELSTCTGCTFDYQSEDLVNCTFKPINSATEPTRYITPLEKVLQRYQSSSIKPIIFLDLHADLGCDISDSRKQWYYTTILYAINTLLNKYSAYDHVLVQANSLEWMLESRNLFPDVKVFLDTDISDDDIEVAADNGFYGIASKNDNISAEEIALAHDKGLRVQVYGTGGYSFTDAIEKSPDYILSDNIPLLQNILNY
jgi:glycerophosphoryl diester phosphodiesterase